MQPEGDVEEAEAEHGLVMGRSRSNMGGRVKNSPGGLFSWNECASLFKSQQLQEYCRYCNDDMDMLYL